MTGDQQSAEQRDIHGEIPREQCKHRRRQQVDPVRGTDVDAKRSDSERDGDGDPDDGSTLRNRPRERDESRMKHIYIPVLEEQKTMGLVLEKFLENMYNGSIGDLLVTFLKNTKSSKKEVKKLRELLEQLDKPE